MQEIVQRFAEEGYMIDPEALELIASSPEPRDELVEGVIRGLERSTLVVGASEVRRCERWLELVGGDGGGVRSPPKRASLKPPSPLGFAEPPSSAPTMPSPSPGEYSPPKTGASERVGLEISIGDPAGGLGIFRPQTGPRAPGLVRLGDPELDGRLIPAWAAKFGPGSELSARGLPSSGSSSPVGVGLPIPPEVDSEPFCLEGLSDITGRSTCIGEYQDFIRYFRDRYSRIREILSGRLNARPIESLRRDVAGREISIIGMVMEVRTSAKGNRVVELEDPSGMVTVIFSKGAPGSEEVETLVPDEVVGVTGTTDGKGRFFGKTLVRPDLQARSLIATGEGGALLLSDVHVGSTYFVEDAWERFIEWVRGETDDPLGISSKVRYAVIAGDLVDGIGIYPGQEADLAIKDIWEQYERAAELVSEIPDRIKIVISPGNHDVVRQAEPQPALPDSLRNLFKKNVTFVGNPATFRLGGVDWLVYHGRSIDDLVLKIPGLSYGEPEKAMVEMLKRRHLSPIYGNRVSIAPEVEDLLVIKRPPAVLHSGHVHTVGMARYKGVTAINSGTWQGQTDFQKKMNIQPTPAIVPYLDLSTMRARRLIFA
ncbi:MAG TPA: DNA-directed DNA polymerase II small subunit [Methanothrix sp.]|nr:DNA-directed DNA polymerase II small subunit [Methanothrix sp.]